MWLKPPKIPADSIGGEAMPVIKGPKDPSCNEIKSLPTGATISSNDIGFKALSPLGPCVAPQAGSDPRPVTILGGNMTSQTNLSLVARVRDTLVLATLACLVLGAGTANAAAILVDRTPTHPRPS